MFDYRYRGISSGLLGASAFAIALLPNLVAAQVSSDARTATQLVPVPVYKDMTVEEACFERVKPIAPIDTMKEGAVVTVKAQAIVQNGMVKHVNIDAGPREFHKAVRDAMMQYKCVAATDLIRIKQTFEFPSR